MSMGYLGSHTVVVNVDSLDLGLHVNVVKLIMVFARNSELGFCAQKKSNVKCVWVGKCVCLRSI